MASAATSASDEIAELKADIAAIKAANPYWASDVKLIDAIAVKDQRILALSGSSKIFSENYSSHFSVSPSRTLIISLVARIPCSSTLNFNSYHTGNFFTLTSTSVSISLFPLRLDCTTL